MAPNFLVSQKVLHSGKNEEKIGKKKQSHKGILHIDHPFYHLIHQENQAKVKDKKRMKVAFKSIKYSLVKAV